MFIGNKIETEFVEEDEHGRFVRKYCYFIVEGEVVIFRDGIAVSVLGPR